MHPTLLINNKNIFYRFYFSMKINNCNITNFRSRKVPRYIYHFTNEHAYKSMCNDGFIKATTKDVFIKDKSVFLVELENFSKNWGFNKSWDKFPEPLQESLLMLASYFTTPSSIENKNKLVILKIPTDKLDSEKLFVRSENKFFEQLLSDKKDAKNLHPDIKQHLEGNTPATKSKLYKNRKEAIEYIYKDNIPIEKAEQIGQILNINTLDYDKNNSVKSILQKILEGLPEENAIRHLRK